MQSPWSVDNEVRVPPTYPVGFWNHFDKILRDPEFPRTSNMVEGFHRGFKIRVNRPKPSVQEYVRAVKEQQVITDFHLDRLSIGKTPSKKRRINNTIETIDLGQTSSFMGYEIINQSSVPSVEMKSGRV